VKSEELGIIAIGERFDPDVETFPEGCHFNYDISGCWLHYLYDQPTPVEVSSIQSGEAQFGLYVKGPLIFLLHQFGQMAWHDAAYSWWLVSPEFRKVPEEEDGHALLKVVMVDTQTGIVVAIRALTFSAEFTTCLHDAIRQQTREPWSKDRHEAAVRHVYSKYSTMDLVNMGEVFCKGGE
jgi:hypothetical protein